MQFFKKIQSTLLDVSIDKEMSLDKGGFSGIVMTELSKTFDCIDHELLIAKMHAYGFDIESVKFIDSYLTRGKQRVKINSSFSE